MTPIKTDKSIIFIDIVDRKGHIRYKIGKDIEKATKNSNFGWSVDSGGLPNRLSRLKPTGPGF
jgi:hypothetical protein